MNKEKMIYIRDFCKNYSISYFTQGYDIIGFWGTNITVKHEDELFLLKINKTNILKFNEAISVNQYILKNMFELGITFK